MTQTARSADVVIVGGGPAGAALGTLLAADGVDVAIFERAAFPRHHVGESLIPAVNLTLERLGVIDRMDALGFPRKHAVQFFSARGPSRPFYFAEIGDPRLDTTWQVSRAEFDAMLLDAAAAAGATVSTGIEAVDAIESGGVVRGLSVRNAAHRVQRINARVVVDASGVQGLLAKRFGSRTQVRGLQNTSIYAHYEDVQLDPGEDAGSTLIFRIDERTWLWLIPLPGRVSIGVVAPASRIVAQNGSPAQILDAAIASSPHLAERMTKARCVSPVRAVRDFSYHARRDGGPGWLLIGDALGFIDSMYSTGLFLAMRSAELAATAIRSSLAGGATRPSDFHGFADPWHGAFARFLVLVQAFYTPDFRFGEFGRRPEFRRGLVELLSGLVDSPGAIEVATALADLADSTPKTRTEVIQHPTPGLD